MNRIEIDAATDEAGSLRIRLPTAPAHHAVRVVVEWEGPEGPAAGWPQDWFEEIFGVITDPTFRLEDRTRARS